VGVLDSVEESLEVGVLPRLPEPTSRECRLGPAPLSLLRAWGGEAIEASKMVMVRKQLIELGCKGRRNR
jgi:hypothetical protein